MRRDINAVSPVIATILVFMIVTSITSTVLFWGVPVINNLDKRYSDEVLSNQFKDVASNFENSLRGNSGASTVVPMDIDSYSTLSTSKKDSTTMISYSFNNSFNFSVDDIDSDSFSILAPENSIDRAECVWLDDSRTCFLSGTKVLMADGSYKDIEDICIGDKVKAYDFENKKTTSSIVSNVFHHNPFEMDDFYLVINNDIKVTPNHEFYTDDGWEYALNLEMGDYLFTSSSSFEEIYSIKKVYNKVFTYDLSVESLHNYFILSNGVNILVHNSDIFETSWHWANKVVDDNRDVEDPDHVLSDDGNFATFEVREKIEKISIFDNIGGEEEGVSIENDIPIGANITGIEVMLQGRGYDGYSDAGVRLSWDYGITWTGYKRTDEGALGRVFSNESIGSSSEDWGREWERSDFSYENFCVELTCTNDEGNGMEIDFIKLKVYYTLPNEPPEATDLTVDIFEDESIWINVTEEVIDPDGNDLNFSSLNVASGPDHGSVDINYTTGEIRYDPNLNYNGADSFNFTIEDILGAVSNEAKATIDIRPVNDPPVAVDDPGSVETNGVTWIDIVSNDYDIETSVDSTSIWIRDPPDYGSLNVYDNGSIKYDHSGDDLPDSFNYSVNDTDGATSNIATVTITEVDDIDQLPSASDPYPGNEDKNIGSPNGDYVEVSLSVYVDDDSDRVGVMFYDAFDNSLISNSIPQVPGRERAEIKVEDVFTYDEQVSWYVKLHDYNDSHEFQTSDTWSFTTRSEASPELNFSSESKNVNLEINQEQNIDFYISNDGEDGSQLTFNLTKENGCDWITSISPTEGVSNNSADKKMIKVTVNSTGKNVGFSDTCNITIDTNAGEGKFTITLTVSEASIEVNNPHSDSIWNAGSIHNISWLYSDQETSNINISLYKNNNYYITLTNYALNSGDEGSFEWSIPYNLTSGNDYKIKVSNSTFAYGFSNYFSIVSPEGYVKNESVEPSYTDGKYTFNLKDSGNCLEGLVLIELWNGNSVPEGRIWIVDTDSLIGNIQNSEGDIKLGLIGGWITSYDSSYSVKSYSNSIFKDNLFALRLNQMVISDDSIHSVQDSKVKIYLSLYADVNREKNSSYYIHIYFDGEISNALKEYLKTNYPSKFCDIDDEKGLFYTPSDSESGCSVVILNSIFNVKMKYH